MCDDLGDYSFFLCCVIILAGRGDYMAQIIQRGPATWQVRVYLGREGGKKKFHNETIHGSRKQAEVAARKLEEQRDAQTITKVPARLTVRDFLVTWFEAVAPQLAASTVAVRRGVMKAWLSSDLAAIKLAKLSAMDIDLVVSGWLAEGFAPYTVQSRLTILHVALEYAVKWELLAINPCTKAASIRKTRVRKPVVLSTEEAIALYNASYSQEHGLVLRFALATGCRPEEYYGLSWKQILWAEGVADISQTRPPVGGIVSRAKTDAGLRKIILPARLLDELRALHDSLHPDPDDLVFWSDASHSIAQRRVNRVLRCSLREAGINKRMRLYDLRHTHASLSISWGYSVREVAARLGHSSPAMTLSVYAHSLNDAAARLASAWDMAPVLPEQKTS